MEFSSSNSGNSGSSTSWQGEENSHDLPRTRDMIRWKSGRRVDPRLLALLESFGEIYDDRREFFKRIFGGLHEELFDKVCTAKEKIKKMKKARSLPRSVSMRERGVGDEIDGLRLERFKVRTPAVAVNGTGDGQSGQTTTSTTTTTTT